MSPNMYETEVHNQILLEKAKVDAMVNEARRVNNVYNLLLYAMQAKNKPLVLLIEFLWKEKGSINPESDIRELDHFLQEKFHAGMNKLLKEYEASGKSIYTIGL